MADTRKDKRAPVSLKVRFKSATLDDFIDQYAKDVSKGGLFIKSKQPMPVGTLLKFELQLKDESRLIHGVGRVVWKREAGDGGSDDSPSGMGIKFIKMDADSRTMVDSIITTRGDAPGQFESGESGAQGASSPPPKSGTLPFFPAALPESELPRPEDRTQVRHASEFLASALAEGGADDAAMQEAEGKAEEARKRQAEIEKEREATRRAELEKAEEEARAEEEREKAAADRKAADKQAVADKNAADDKAAAAAKADEKKAAAAKADDKKADDKKAADSGGKKAAAGSKADKGKDSKKGESKDKAGAKAVRPAAEISTERPAPASEPNSMAMPIAVAAVALVGLGIFFYMNPIGGTAAPDPDTTTEPPTVAGDGEDGLEGEGLEGEGLDGEDPLAIEDEGTEPELPPVPTIAVQVESTPPGATITIAGEEAGVTPSEVQLPEGEAASVEVSLRGYATGTQEVTAAEGQRPVRIALTALPWIIEVASNPPGARIRTAGRTITAPGRVTLTRAPSATTSITGSLRGHVDESASVEPDAFSQTEEGMLAQVTLTLTPRAPTVRDTTGGGTTGGGTTGGGTAAGTTGGGTTGGGTTGTTGGGTTAGTGGTTGGGTTGGGTAAGTTGGGTTGGGTAAGTTGGGTTGGGTAAGTTGGGTTGGGTTGGGTTGGGTAGGGTTGGGTTGGGTTGGGSEDPPPPPPPPPPPEF